MVCSIVFKAVLGSGVRILLRPFICEGFVIPRLGCLLLAAEERGLMTGENQATYSR